MEKLALYIIYNSRGSKTILAKAGAVQASVPAGKSVGSHEAPFVIKSLEKDLKFAEDKVLPNIELGMPQKDFDAVLESICKNKCGVAVTLALSALNLKYLAYLKGKEVYNYKKKTYVFPKVLANTIGGGLHSNNKMPIQEILAIKKSSNYPKAIDDLNSFYLKIENYFKKKNIYFGYNDEGAIAFPENSYKKALDLAYSNKGKLSLGCDFAANSYYKNGRYKFGYFFYSRQKYFKKIKSIIEKYGLFYIEDPFYEEDFNLFAELSDVFKDRLVCGDDLYTTNYERLKEGIKQKAGNTVLVKPNQIGYISKVKKFVELANKNSFTTVISHRSGETNDFLISDLALLWDIPYIKESIRHGERLAKHNRLLMLYKDLSLKS